MCSRITKVTKRPICLGSRRVANGARYKQLGNPKRKVR
jgi:hypothetical protein